MIVGKRQGKKHTPHQSHTELGQNPSSSGLKHHFYQSFRRLNLLLSYLSPAGGIINSILDHLIAPETAEEAEFDFFNTGIA